MKSILHYGEPAYWELRYQEELNYTVGKLQNFDLYVPYENGQVVFNQYKLIIIIFRYRNIYSASIARNDNRFKEGA